MTSFECHQQKNIHCHSFQRVCLPCVIERKFEKCFVCQKGIKKKNTHDDFEIDFETIKRDSFSIYTCVFCQKEKGTHLEITKHVIQHHLYNCSCGHSILLENIQEHLKSCKDCLYCIDCKKDTTNCLHKKKSKVSCKFCGLEFTTKEKIVVHYMNVHLNNFKNKITILKEMLTTERKQYYDLLSLIENLYHEM